MMVNSFEALGPPGKELGSDAAAAARYAVRGCCVWERLMIWEGLVAGVRVCVCLCVWFLVRCPHAAFGWRIHCGVEVTELSTNKQHSLSHGVRFVPDERLLIRCRLAAPAPACADSGDLAPVMAHQPVHLYQVPLQPVGSGGLADHQGDARLEGK